MLLEYFTAAMEMAEYEIIDDPEPYYGSISGISGVWATGKTLEECRRNLSSALDDWLLFSVAHGHALPALKGVTIEAPKRVGAV